MPRMVQNPTSLDAVETVQVDCDILIIGGGNAGCFSAVEAAKLDPSLKVVIMEKAHIMRSGACSAGMDAINTYIPEGKTPEDLVRWCRSQVGGGPIREDLALSNARELNESVDDLERWGLPILRDAEGKIRYRGAWDISIHGEQLKPIMAEKAIEAGARIYNRVACTQLLMDGGRCVGALGFGVRDGKFYVFNAKATINATGGAAGLYKSYTADATDSHHQIWMCPYCVGTGYAVGIRQGAEMTSMEQRWVATRTKDFCGPVDTISVGYKAPIINAKGERIMKQRYAHLGADKAPRYIRANAPMEEWLAGRGPTYCDTRGMEPELAKQMMTDYLNERPSFVLFLASRGQDPVKEPIEIYGSDPYIVGGHTQSGFWVDMERMTTIPGLFAAGETAGGNPNKFVGGCAAEGKLALRGAADYIKGLELPEPDAAQIEAEKARVFAPLLRGEGFDGLRALEMEERLQRLMDEYAGGTSQFYRTNEERLDYALKHLAMLREQTKYLAATDLHDLMSVHEVIDRIDVAEVLCHHLKFRKETRWQGWQTRADYPEVDPAYDCHVESRRNMATGEIETFTRPYEQLVPGDRYKP
ncbi:adenylyl-sulfate reductase subunit alpha [Fundidesulfovibrio soli]|uniref:adenylyl-sulfate reductase subunit alpha n=1 Tax=Fundidesulfovibrio soli TaxID=2922716 RepID=UPI001FAFF017|nr:adenylyl-sulfate reductase subunit alpha [Fundidesulfovibrio soli]